MKTYCRVTGFFHCVVNRMLYAPVAIATFAVFGAANAFAQGAVIRAQALFLERRQEQFGRVEERAE